MSTIDVIRKKAPNRVEVDNVLEIPEQNSLLETPSLTWSESVPKFRRIPDVVHPMDYTPRTSLGNNVNFMRVFRDALTNYDHFYLNGGKWCETKDVSSPQLEEVSSPFELRNGDPSFAQKLKTIDDSRVIFIGDIHSSFHSFIEIIDNLVDRSILRDDLNIDRHYYIIFLGDIFDRGPFALDIINIVFRIKNLNFDRVFLVNGNHEDRGMYNTNGTGAEIEAQLRNETDEEVVHALMRRLPPVIFLYYGGSIIQCCHGGIERTYAPKAFLESEYIFHFHGYDSPAIDRRLPESRELEDYGLVNHGLRWTDFSMEERGIGNRPGRGDIYGVSRTNSYLRVNNLTGIVRGHQDMHHISLLPKMVLRDGRLCVLPRYKMFSPNSRYPSVRDTGVGFERLPFPNAFDAFSVFTTSTAVWARQHLGYYTYMEMRTNDQAILDAQSKIDKMDHRVVFDGLIDAKGVTDLRTFTDGDRIHTVFFETLMRMMVSIGGDTRKYEDLFPIYELLTYKPFTNNVAEETSRPPPARRRFLGIF